MKLETKELKPELWPELEKLFGTNGACGGCWCMAWRLEKGETWAELKGETNKRRLQSLVHSGKAQGILAFADGEPVGWCNFGRREDYAKLNRAPSMACKDADQVWSIPCFFVKNGFRNQGVAEILLRAALKSLKLRNVKIVEGYPVKPPKNGKPIPGAFAWTGTRPLFEKAGFKIVGNRNGGKQRVRKEL